MFLFASESIIPKSISTALIVVLLANLVLFAALFQPQAAQAQWVVTDPTQIVQNIAKYVWDAAKWVYEKAVDAQEAAYRIWDQFKSNNGVVAEIVSTLLLIMMHQVLAKITNDIVAWINGGGKGKIRVLQDPGKFLTDALDEAGGVLAGAILNVDPATLCDASYLKFKLKAAFTGPYAVPTFDEKVACTFTGAAQGLKNFQEDFTNGGWASFIELARKENNQFGQELILAEELARIKSEKGAESVAKLNISKGFLAQEKCTITKALSKESADGFVGMDADQNSQYNTNALVGKSLEEAIKTMGRVDDYDYASDPDEFKRYWKMMGGDYQCKTVTPAEQISELANTVLQAPIKRLEDAINGLTGKLGTGAGSVLKPYVLAIGNAGLNLLLKKEMGLITNALASAKKPRKARRQSTSSLQENTMLAQSAGALAGSVNDFRSFMLKALLEFSLYVSSAGTALTSMDVLGRIPINRAETEIRGGTWYLGGWNPLAAPPAQCGSTTASCGACPPEYEANYDTTNPKTLTTTSGAPYTCASTPFIQNYDAAATSTNAPGKVFFEEARWCGAYYQEIAIPLENPEAKQVPPLAGHDPLSTGLLAGVNCPTLTYGTVSVPGDCTDPTGWIQYNLDGDAAFEMATRIVGYDDTQVDSPTADVDMADRFIRQSIVGVDSDNNSIPDAAIPGLSPANITFSETLIYTARDSNHNAFVDAVGTSTASELKGLFEMRPEYSKTIIRSDGTTVTSLPQGLAQAAVAGDYVFGGHNQFGHSNKVFRLSTGAFVATLPFAVSGSTAVYYPPNGRIYLFGGFNSTQSYSAIWEFNPSSNAVRTMSARLPSPTAGMAAAYYPPTGRIYLFGGADKKGPHTWIIEYNQATDSLVTKNTPLLSPLAHASAATAFKSPPNAQQRIFVFGGFTTNGFSSPAIFEYDPARPDDGFSPLTRKSADIEARGFLAAAPGASPEIITLIGGQSEYGLLATVEQYNAQNDSISRSLLPAPRSKASGGAIGVVAVAAGGSTAADVAVAPENAKVFPQGDIYYIPASIYNESITTPFWEKYFSPSFDGGSAMLLNTRTEFTYNDFTGTVGNATITSRTNTDSNLVWLAPPFYPELLEKAQELMEKSRIISGYNYPSAGVKNYQSGLADQLGATPDDDPYDNNPSNPAYN
ncbi:MAG: hypothetical protein NUV61_01925, partial [Candidatus Azambacteria bacterium]|nr:hypothetical protein [Candidatus Azambacteria bacterium]